MSPSGRYFETVIKPGFNYISGAIYSQKKYLSNELTYLQSDATILEPIHFQMGAILKEMPPEILYLY